MADADWFGIAVPETFGGASLGLTEAVVMMQAVAEAGGSMELILLFDTEEQQGRMIPPIVSGEEKFCFAVTEPKTGLDTTSLKTSAEKVDGGDVLPLNVTDFE